MSFNIKTFSQLNITSKTDTDLIINFNRKDKNGEAVDTSSYSYDIEIKDRKGSTTIVSTTTTGNSDGLFTLDLNKTKVNNLDAEKCYYYSIRETNDSNREQTILEGNLILEND